MIRDALKYVTQFIETCLIKRICNLQMEKSSNLGVQEFRNLETRAFVNLEI